MDDRYDAIVLLGPPGSGKSYLGNTLRESGIASYVELEPLLRRRFGTGQEFESRIHEVGAFLWQSYTDQLSQSDLTVAFESAGVLDRPLLERLQREYRVGLVHVRTDRALCISRVVARPAEMNISRTTDPRRLERHHDLWQERILPTYDFTLSVDGGDAVASVAAIRSLLGGKR